MSNVSKLAAEIAGLRRQIYALSTTPQLGKSSIRVRGESMPLNFIGTEVLDLRHDAEALAEDLFEANERLNQAREDLDLIPGQIADAMEDLEEALTLTVEEIAELAAAAEILAAMDGINGSIAQAEIDAVNEAVSQAAILANSAAAAAELAAIQAAEADATAKANAAESAALHAAAIDAQEKADAAQEAAELAAADDATDKADAARIAALNAAAIDAQEKADAALLAAEQAADAAEQAAIEAAALDATAKANAAQQAAIDAAALTAADLADLAEAAAISQAQSDAADAYGAAKGLVEEWTFTGSTEIDGGSVRADTIDTAQLAANAVTANKIVAGAIVAGKIAADAIVANNIKAGEIGTAHLVAEAVTANKIAAGAIEATHIQADAISATHIAAGAIGAEEIAANAITADKILAGAITAGKLAADSVLASNIKAGEIAADHLAANSITTAHLTAEAVTAAKIAASQITTEHLVGLAVTADKIAANTISADKIAANAITAEKLAAEIVLTTALVAGDPNDAHATLTSEGLRSYAPSPDGGVQEVVRIGSPDGGGEFFALTDESGQVAASIDNTGAASFNALSVNGALEVDGFPLLGGLREYEPIVGSGALLGGHLDKIPRGLVAYGAWSPSGQVYNATQTLHKLSFVAEPGRSYRVTVGSALGNISSVSTARGFQLRVWTPTAPGGTTLQNLGNVAHAYVVSSSTSAFVTFPSITRILRCNAAGRSSGGELNAGVNEIEVLVNANASATMTFYNHPLGVPVTVEDVGLDFPQSGTTTAPGGGGGGTAKQTYTTVWRASDSRSYNGNNNSQVSPQPNDLIHGPVPGSTSNNRYAIAVMAGGAVSSSAGNEVGKTIASALSGSAVKKIEAYVYASHWYWGSGGTATIRSYSGTSIPGTGSASGSVVTSASWPKPGGRWVDITNVGSAATRGIIIGATGTTNLLTYGRFANHADSTVSRRPQLRITYER